MVLSEITLGRRVRTNQAFSGVSEGTEGIICEDYGTGITIAWDKPDRPLPEGLTPKQIAEMYQIDPECPLKDGFDKETELQYLEAV